MLNTGLLLSKPGESGYAIYRRMLIANQTPSFITKEMSKEFESSGLKYSPSIELGTGKKSHRLASLARKKEKRLLGEYNSARYQSSKIQLYNGYHPQKHCPYCAEIAYHSYLFDLPWIKYCPIHNAKLLRNCPECKRKWPMATGILNNKCKICGVNVTIKEILTKHSLFTRFKSKFHSNRFIEKILLTKRHKVIGRKVTRRREGRRYSLVFHAPKLKDINVFQASVILRDFESDNEIKKLLKRFDIPEYK